MVNVNKSNLIPVTERSKDEARENSRKGGIASGVARRRKKEMKEYAEAILSCLVKDDKLIKQLNKLGAKPASKKGYNFYEAMIIGQIAEAIKGNTKAYNAIKDTVEPKTGLVSNNVEDLTPLADMLADNDDEDNDE